MDLQQPHWFVPLSAATKYTITRENQESSGNYFKNGKRYAIVTRADVEEELDEVGLWWGNLGPYFIRSGPTDDAQLGVDANSPLRRNVDPTVILSL